MNRNAAAFLSVVVSIGAVLLVPWALRRNFEIDGDALSNLSLAIVSFASGGGAMWLESKSEKPSLDIIGLAVVLNFIGLGVVVYELLTREDHSRR